MTLWLGRPIPLPHFQEYAHWLQASHPLPRMRDGKNEVTPPQPGGAVFCFCRTCVTGGSHTDSAQHMCMHPTRYATTLSLSHTLICSFNWSFTWPWASEHLSLVPPPTETSRPELPLSTRICSNKQLPFTNPGSSAQAPRSLTVDLGTPCLNTHVATLHPNQVP